jgi:hypothetical protein
MDEVDEVLEAVTPELPEIPEPDPGPGSFDITSNQTAAHSTTQVAIAQTGGNVVGSSSTQSNSSAQAAGAGSSGPSVVVVTGDARSSGSADVTGVHQRVVAAVTDDGRVEVVQIALVINIGIGVANSGTNAAAAGNGGVGGSRSSATSGGARAVGNDAGNYLTQAAIVDAVDSAALSDQVATSRTIGIAISNTGINLVFGEVVLNDPGATSLEVVAQSSGTATVNTGLAQASGNQSSTEIGQTAVVDAGAGGVITVVQRAVVTNVGLALANSGSNGVSSVLGTPEATALWLMIAALLGEDGFAPVAGPPTEGAASISSGGADAIGNRSTTVVSQTVIATAERGLAAARQSAVVSNTGLAVANSGLNTVGNRSGSTSQGVQQLSDIGVELARFLDALVHPASQGLPTLSQRLQVGSLGIDLSGIVSSTDLELASAASGTASGSDDGRAGGARIRIRQVSGTITIALSVANTGGNAAVTTASYLVVGNDARVQATELLAASSESTLRTGDAVATNLAVSVICQRYNAETEVCLVPPAPVVATPPTPPLTGGPDGSTVPATSPVPRPIAAAVAVLPAVEARPANENPEVAATVIARGQQRGVPGLGLEELPRTGSEPGVLVRVALALLAMGSAASLASRRGRDRAAGGSR